MRYIVWACSSSNSKSFDKAMFAFMNGGFISQLWLRRFELICRSRLSSTLAKVLQISGKETVIEQEIAAVAACKTPTKVSLLITYNICTRFQKNYKYKINDSYISTRFKKIL